MNNATLRYGISTCYAITTFSNRSKPLNHDTNILANQLQTKSEQRELTHTIAHTSL
jgi:hypothetical protein